MPEEMPLIARVEAQSGSSAEQVPVAVWIGGRRILVESINDDAVVTGAEAGSPHLRRLVVELADGHLLRLVRELPEGSWRVFRIEA